MYGVTRRVARERARRSVAAASIVALLATTIVLLTPHIGEAAQPAVCATPGASGTGSTITGVVNTYYPAPANAGAGATTITVGTARGATTTPIAAGDLLLVIQMQDSTINTSNDNNYGANGGTGRGQTSTGNTGKYEYVKAVGLSG